MYVYVEWFELLNIFLFFCIYCKLRKIEECVRYYFVLIVLCYNFKCDVLWIDIWVFFYEIL